jgi:hypothetical protein
MLRGELSVAWGNFRGRFISDETQLMDVLLQSYFGHETRQFTHHFPINSSRFKVIRPSTSTASVLISDSSLDSKASHLTHLSSSHSINFECSSRVFRTLNGWRNVTEKFSPPTTSKSVMDFISCRSAYLSVL